MLRLASLPVRCASRSHAGGGHTAASSAVAAAAVPLPAFSRDMMNKLSRACNKRSYSSLSSPLAGTQSPLASAHATPVQTPRASPAHSRRSSFSCRPRTGISAVISPFMPMTFARAVQSRATGSAAGERGRPVLEKEQEPFRTGSTPVVFQQNKSTPVFTPYSQLDIASSGVPPHTAADRVVANPGLSAFLGKVYTTTGVSVGASLLGSWVLTGVLAPSMWLPAAIGGLVVSLGSLFALYRQAPTTVRQGDKLVTVNSAGRQLAFASFVAANAVMLTPMVATSIAVHPLIIPVAAVSAGAVMALSSLYAYSRPHGSLSAWAGPALGALGTMILIQLGAAASLYFVGPNLFSSVAYSVFPYVSVGIFSVLTAIDTQAAVVEYESGRADHLWHAAGFFLNAINLFSAISRIIRDVIGD